VYQTGGMDQLNDGCPSVGPFIDFPIQQFGGQEHEHRAHLLALSINYVVGYPIEQCDLGGHGFEEFFLKKLHLIFYGFPNLRNDFQRNDVVFGFETLKVGKMQELLERNRSFKIQT
jgi:hypothetical protein